MLRTAAVNLLRKLYGESCYGRVLMRCCCTRLRAGRSQVFVLSCFLWFCLPQIFLCVSVSLCNVWRWSISGAQPVVRVDQGELSGWEALAQEVLLADEEACNYTPTTPDEEALQDEEVKREEGVKKRGEIPGLLAVSGGEGAEEEPVDTVFLHAATLSLSLDNLPTSVGHWHRIIQQQYRRATFKFHPDKGGSQDLLEQLERARGYLKEWAAKWAVIDNAFSKLEKKLCQCSKCTDIYDRRCKWCLGINKRHGHIGRCKEWGGVGSVTGYFFRNHASAICQ